MADHIIFLVYPETKHDVDVFVRDLETTLRSCPSGKGYWVETHVGFTKADAEKSLEPWRLLAPLLASRTSIEGLTFHEAMAFEFHCPELWTFASQCAAL